MPLGKRKRKKKMKTGGIHEKRVQPQNIPHQEHQGIVPSPIDTCISFSQHTYSYGVQYVNLFVCIQES